MTPIKKLALLCAMIFVYVTASAQIEVAKLSSKGFSPFGVGAYLNFAIPITYGNAAVVEGGLYYFIQDGSHMAVAPVMAGYRQLLGQDDFGWYAEPVAGYTFGATDIQKFDANGAALYKPGNGGELDQKVGGPIAGVGFGYLFEPSGRIQFNISLRAEHVFVTGGDPGLTIVALRISHSFSFGRKD